MRKEEILEILQDWNFWNKELDTGIERQAYIKKVLGFLKTNVITAIIGVRRCGKSYIIRQVIKSLIKSNMDKKNILMINLEDRRFAEFYPKLLDEIYETYLQYLQPNKTPYIFLDEVHNIPDWERWARTIHELGKAKILVSGSSSKLLKGELATLLTGRHLDAYVFPMSFNEFLYLKNLNIEDKLTMLSKRTEIQAYLKEYLEFGGFPEVILSEEKKQLLLTYFDDILTKDIEKRYKIREKEKLRALTKFYLTNIASTITFNSMKKFLATTTNTIEKFSLYLEEVNLIFFIKRFSYKVKEQEKASRKVYSIDVGISNSVGFKFSSDTGKVAENIVAIELKKSQILDPNKEIYYWQDTQGKEVDFVVKKMDKVVQLIQVCWDTEEYKTKEREITALLKASKELNCDNLLIITENKNEEETIENKKIIFIPLWKWLLGEQVM